MARARKVKAGDTRRSEEGVLGIAIAMTEFLGPHWLKCQQVDTHNRLSYTGFFEYGDAMNASGAINLSCPSCGLFSVWNMRVDRKLTKEAKRYLAHCKVSNPNQ